MTRGLWLLLAVVLGPGGLACRAPVARAVTVAACHIAECPQCVRLSKTILS